MNAHEEREALLVEHNKLKELLAERTKQVVLMEFEIQELRDQLNECMSMHEAEHCSPGGGPFIESRPDLQRRLAQ